MNGIITCTNTILITEPYTGDTNSTYSASVSVTNCYPATLPLTERLTFN